MATTGRKVSAEAWRGEMDEMRRLAANVGRHAAVLARRTNAMLGRTPEDEFHMDELEDSADSAIGWAIETEGARGAKSLEDCFEATRNCLNEAVWILDDARTALQEKRPGMLGKPPAWA